MCVPIVLDTCAPFLLARRCAVLLVCIDSVTILAQSMFFKAIYSVPIPQHIVNIWFLAL